MTSISCGFIASSTVDAVELTDVAAGGGWGFNAFVRAREGTLTIDARRVGRALFTVRDDSLRGVVCVACARDFVVVCDGARFSRVFVVDDDDETALRTWINIPDGIGAVVEFDVDDYNRIYARDDAGKVWVFDIEDVSGSARELSIPAPATRVAVGSKHAVVVVETGAVYGIGWNLYGTLGLGHCEDVDSPKLIRSLSSAGVEIIDACCGSNFTIMLSSTGDAYACGSNSNGALGLGPDAPASTSTPTLIEAPSDVSWRALQCGASHVVATSTTGALYFWGSNAHGQCDVEPQTSLMVLTPTRARSVAKHPSSVVVGRWHVTAVMGDRPKP